MITKRYGDKLAGWAIKAAREYRGLDIGELAAQLGWHRNTLSKVERGERPVKEVELLGIASVLEWPIEWLRAPKLPNDLGGYHELVA